MTGISGLLSNSLNNLSGVSSTYSGGKAVGQESGSDFSNVLSDALEQYRELDNEGDYATLDLLSGNTNDLSSALISTEKSELALNFTVAVRNKAVEAYKEIMNMQV
ncbi:Flagellar hook-basal body complex protein FliE [bioreactor metagenome]|uniref:Flagellar hook-basal body complex protein FliE n=1 Tax=bioreactor metagenome TaxID=1076179 RepID=A0A644YAZ0_9ZZZZ